MALIAAAAAAAAVFFIGKMKNNKSADISPFIVGA